MPGMGLLFLTRHESRLVLNGREEDPTWQPLPGSMLDRAWDGDDPDGSVEEALAGRTQRQQRFLDVNATSKHWGNSARTRALLVTNIAQGHQAIVGVGNCVTKARRGWLGTAAVRLSDWRVFGRPVPLADLLANLPARVRPVVARLFDEEDSREMPTGAAGAVATAMRELVRT